MQIFKIQAKVNQRKNFVRQFSFLDETWKTPATKLPMFTVGRNNGFLSREQPITDLPKKYEVIEKLLAAAMIDQPNGKKGLLWTGDFGKTLEKELPQFDLSDVKDHAL